MVYVGQYRVCTGWGGVCRETVYVGQYRVCPAGGGVQRLEPYSYI
jgi:hypothetical protein